ncbi:hypothetical protein [Streptomyces sp. NPDC012888]|uniref:hypothetical protein n=1 Tax=Streptomyces sp. NPDC012888 TaxID=3364855 RepID=UPI0036CAFD56
MVLVAADTGHRYVDTVHARHREARAIGDLAPRGVADRSGQALPWSRMRWDRAGAPAPAPAVP